MIHCSSVFLCFCFFVFWRKLLRTAFLLLVWHHVPVSRGTHQYSASDNSYIPSSQFCEFCEVGVSTSKLPILGQSPKLACAAKRGSTTTTTFILPLATWTGVQRQSIGLLLWTARFKFHRIMFFVYLLLQQQPFSWTTMYNNNNNGHLRLSP